MCLLIVKKPSGMIPDSHFREGWDSNPHGAGYAFVREGKIVTRKFTTVDRFLRSYREAERQNPDSPFLIHFRFATHGGKGNANVHPFPICNGRVVFAHNGILSAHESPMKDESDTRFFGRTVLAHRSPNQVLSAEFGDWLSTLIGWGNRLAFLSETGGYLIVNEEEGVWETDVWYSNTTFRARAPLPEKKGARNWSGREWWERAMDVYDEEEGEERERNPYLTDGDMYDLGYASAMTGDDSLDADEFSEDQWRSYRAGYVDGLAELQSAD